MLRESLSEPVIVQLNPIPLTAEPRLQSFGTAGLNDERYNLIRKYTR